MRGLQNCHCLVLTIRLSISSASITWYRSSLRPRRQQWSALASLGCMGSSSTQAMEEGTATAMRALPQSLSAKSTAETHRASMGVQHCSGSHKSSRHPPSTPSELHPVETTFRSRAMTTSRCLPATFVQLDVSSELSPRPSARCFPTTTRSSPSAARGCRPGPQFPNCSLGLAAFLRMCQCKRNSTAVPHPVFEHLIGEAPIASVPWAGPSFDALSAITHIAHAIMPEARRSCIPLVLQPSLWRHIGSAWSAHDDGRLYDALSHVPVHSRARP